MAGWFQNLIGLGIIVFLGVAGTLLVYEAISDYATAKEESLGLTLFMVVLGAIALHLGAATAC